MEGLWQEGSGRDYVMAADAVWESLDSMSVEFLRGGVRFGAGWPGAALGEGGLAAERTCALSTGAFLSKNG